MKTDVDALIIGGGPSGASAAILLARAGWSVAVVEKKAFPRRKVCGEFISATSWPLLRELGVAAALLRRAGPEVRRVGFFAGDTILAADMPSPPDALQDWGRALGRELLDTILLARAAQAGAQVWQPEMVSRIERADGEHVCTTASQRATDGRILRARVVIAAHGSWQPGTLLTQPPRRPARASDLFAFKAHFHGAQLPSGLMPLLVFPGGYGGMVQTDGGRISLSCCIRQDALEQCRHQASGAPAGQGVLAHIQSSCRGVREALSGAARDGAWLSAGPIRPGIRSFGREGLYAIGNAAGEAHPVVAEGISMAIQSAWLLCGFLVAHRDAVLSRDAPEAREALGAIGRDYETNWRRNFATRIHAAALFAHLAMRPATARLAGGLLKRVPAILTLGAQWSGKAQPLRCPTRFDTA